MAATTTKSISWKFSITFK